MNFQIPLFYIIITAKLIAGNKFNQTITMETLSRLKSSYVHIKNESAAFEKINKIISQGPENLQFITDFDRTVTKEYQNHTISPDVFEILFHCKNMPQSNMNDIAVALSKFLKSGSNPASTIEQKKQQTEDFYRTAHENLRGFECDRKEVEALARQYGPSFRDRANELFAKLQFLNIPVVVVSGGLADVIKELFNREKVKHEDMHIIANSLKFNEALLDGLQNHENLVDAYNKKEFLNKIIHSENFKNRKNVIVMGDHLGDAMMMSGFESELTVFKMGFFYNQTKANMNLYKDAFDIVLDDDQTMNVILDIINLL